MKRTGRACTCTPATRNEEGRKPTRDIPSLKGSAGILAPPLCEGKPARKRWQALERNPAIHAAAATHQNFQMVVVGSKPCYLMDDLASHGTGKNWNCGHSVCVLAGMGDESRENLSGCISGEFNDFVPLPGADQLVECWENSRVESLVHWTQAPASTMQALREAAH